MSHRSWIYLAVVAAAFQMIVLEANASAADSLVVNGDFQRWSGGAPDGWEVDVGARNGADDPKSECKSISGPALMLRGDSSTMAWHAVSQEIAAKAGGSYRLAFESSPRTSSGKVVSLTTAMSV